MNTNQIGALPYQHLKQLLEDGRILGSDSNLLQPASLDLTVSGEIYRMRGTYLPKPGETVRELVTHGAVERVSLSHPLERNAVYLCRLQESLALPSDIHGSANNKSSSGRINLWTRLVCDGTPSFDQVPAGYIGELWIEIIPKSFPVRLGEGARLNQLRLSKGDGTMRGEELLQAHLREHFLCDRAGNIVLTPHAVSRHGITMTIDLLSTDVVGYRCKATSGLILDYNHHQHLAENFFEPIFRPKSKELILHPDEFYILVTQEGVRVPADYAVEMAPYDVGKGEFRSHYAGFFDPGFGSGPDNSGRGTPAVLEVITKDSDFILRHAQPICTMTYEKLLERTELLYGDERLGSHYATQSGPRLSKHFS